MVQILHRYNVPKNGLKVTLLRLQARKLVARVAILSIKLVAPAIVVVNGKFCSKQLYSIEVNILFALVKPYPI